MVVGPVYRNASLGIELPRPFDDWIFAPATERGTTSVIFHPRGTPLGDHLWGVLVLSPWDGPPPLDGLADRRVADTWRRLYGSSFELLSRDSVDVGGVTAIRLRMTGNIQRAVVDIEEYLAARGTDLILLQFRYPRGVPRDSIGEGYARVLAGLRLRSAAEPVATTDPYAPVMDGGQYVFEVPLGMTAITAGTMTAELVAGGRRTMRFRPPVEDARPVYAVGRYRMEERQAGRLGLILWRSLDSSLAVTRVSDAAIATLVRGWARYWTAFGPVPLAELAIVETNWPTTIGGPGIVFLGDDASEAVLLRELSRTWWGGFARGRGRMAGVINEALPAWSPLVAGSVLSDSLALAVERARREAGDDVFRTALRTLSLDARSSDGAIDAFLASLGPAAGSIRSSLR